MALTHDDPPHIKLYDWPNVPERAAELADELDIEDILCVVVVPKDMHISAKDLGLVSYDEIDDSDVVYQFIH